jgi:hypothetical protein
MRRYLPQPVALRERFAARSIRTITVFPLVSNASAGASNAAPALAATSHRHVQQNLLAPFRDKPVNAM